MQLHRGKIWVKIIIALVILLILGVIGAFILAKQIKKTASNTIHQQFVALISPARNKFLQMLPEDYDKERARITFDNLFSAVQVGKIRKNLFMSDLMPYLLQSVEDKTLTKEEADSVLKLMESTILP